MGIRLFISGNAVKFSTSAIDMVASKNGVRQT
jgi:hypothetical protein